MTTITPICVTGLRLCKSSYNHPCCFNSLAEKLRQAFSTQSIRQMEVHRARRHLSNLVAGTAPRGSTPSALSIVPLPLLNRTPQPSDPLRDPQTPSNLAREASSPPSHDLPGRRPTAAAQEGHG